MEISVSLEQQGAVLREFVSLLSTHSCNGVTSQECLNRQREDFPKLFQNDLEVAVPSLEITNIAHDYRNLQDRAADRLAQPYTVYTLTELCNVPQHVLGNAMDTFETLWRARLRQSAAALCRSASTHLEFQDIPSSLLSAVVTDYKTLDYVTRLPDHEEAIIIPIVLNVVMDWNLSTVITLRMEAPGIVQGHFSDRKLAKVILELDTSKLLNSMMQQAKILAKSAISLYWQSPTIMSEQPAYQREDKTPLEELFDNDVMPPPRPRQHHTPTSLDMLTAAAEQEAAKDRMHAV